MLPIAVWLYPQVHDPSSDTWTLFDDEKVRHIPGVNSHGPPVGATGGGGGGTGGKKGRGAAAGKGGGGKGGGRGARSKKPAKGSSGDEEDEAAAADSEADAEFLREVDRADVLCVDKRAVWCSRWRGEARSSVWEA